MVTRIKQFFAKHSPAMRRQGGQALIELLVAMGIAALMLPALATAMVATRGGRVQQEQRLEANALLREANEAVRIVRQTGWAGMGAAGTATYHPAISGSTWTLASGAETIGTFTRQIVISDVQRNTTTGAIVTSGGTVDPSTKKVVSTVSWTTPLADSVETEAYYQRYAGNTTWTQTTQSEFGSGTNSGTVVKPTGGGGGVAYVQSAGTTADTASLTIARAFTANVTAGNLIVVSVSWDSNSSSAITCTDSQGNVYTTALNVDDTTNHQAHAICYAPNTAGGATTVTATFGGSVNFRRMIVSEYSGIATTDPVDVTASNLAVSTSTPNAVTSTAATTTANGNLIFGAVMDTSSADTITAGTGFTQRNNVNNEDLATQDLIQASAGSIASTQTFGSSGHRYIALMVAFKASTGDGQVELAPVAGSGIAYVQGASSTNDAAATTIARAFTTNVTGGNLIAVAVSWDTSVSATITCSDSQNNTYTTATNTNDGVVQQALAVCYAPNAAGGATTVTATFGGSVAFRRIVVSEYSGVATSSPVDVTKTNIAVGTTATDNVTSTAATTTTAGDLIFGAVMDDDASPYGTISAGTGFTQRAVTNQQLATQDRIQAAVGSITSTQTFSVAHRYLAHMVAFKPEAGSGTDWKAPTILSSFDAAGTQDALDVAAAGNYAYLCDGTIFTIIDISDPVSPTLVGTYSAGSTIRHVYIDGSHAYLSTANNSAELTIVNISNPASPSLAATVNLTDTNDGFSTFVTGGYAYVGRALDTTTGTNEFYIINVTNPTSPSVLGSVNLTGSVNNIKVNGNYAYLATAIDTQELVVVNVTNKNSPTIASSYNAPGTADVNDLAIDAAVLFMGTVNNTSGTEVYAFNLTSPASPSLIDTYEVGGNVTGISNLPGRLFLSTAIANRQLIVLNAANPADLLLEANKNMGANANDVKASGDLVFVATASDTQEMRIVGPSTYGGGGIGGYQASGTFDSFPALDAGASAGYNYLTFSITEPASTDVRIQIATNDDNSTWTYVGPDGTTGSYYSAPGTIRITTTGRYLRYRATLTGPGTSTPALHDITINYSP